MKNRKFIVGLLLVLIVWSCGGPKVLTTQINNAEKAVEAGNYSQAVELWQSYFENTDIEAVDGSNFAKAAQAAYKAGNTKLAINWFDQARYKNFANAQMYSTLAGIYRSQKNVSKEMSALEFYKQNYTDNINEVNSRLFQLYIENGLNDKALKTWSQLDNDSKNQVENLIGYFDLNAHLKNNDLCDSLASVILTKQPENVVALEWNAKKYYWKAENRYRSQMKKYNSNKTRQQYAVLLKQLDLVTADFKRALPFFQKLWKIEPGEKYATYMANIYARFGDEKKSKSYNKFIK